MSFIASFDMFDGRTVHLRALYAQATYAWHLEGAHTSVTNDCRIRGFVKKATLLFGDMPAHVVPPARTTGRAIEGLGDGGDPVYREWLPPVCCIASLTSAEVDGADGCFSDLVVIWFQEEPPPVPVQPVLADIVLGLDWDAMALSYWP